MKIPHPRYWLSRLRSRFCRHAYGQIEVLDPQRLELVSRLIACTTCRRCGEMCYCAIEKPGAVDFSEDLRSAVVGAVEMFQHARRRDWWRFA